MWGKAVQSRARETLALQLMDQNNAVCTVTRQLDLRARGCQEKIICPILGGHFVLRNWRHVGCFLFFSRSSWTKLFALALLETKDKYIDCAQLQAARLFPLLRMCHTGGQQCVYHRRVHTVSYNHNTRSLGGGGGGASHFSLEERESGREDKNIPNTIMRELHFGRKSEML